MAVLGIDIGGSSIKLAALEGEALLWTGQSEFYIRPAQDQLATVLREAIKNRPMDWKAVGLCVPGLLDPRKRMITMSVNMPGLAGISLDDFVDQSLGQRIRRLEVVNDAIAAATDLAIVRKLAGRALVIAIGTGVGAAVMDDGKPLNVENDSPGHVGQIDVSLDNNPPLGPDDGAGSLEAYIGVHALIKAYGSMEQFFNTVRISDDSMRALARAIRICHAIYRPQYVVLAGGVGMRLKHLNADLKKAVDMNLTSIARSDWTLTSAEHDFHAAIGAARMASRMKV